VTDPLTDFESRLRATLDDHAPAAPDATGLATGARRRLRRRRTTWAVVATAVVAAAIPVGLTLGSGSGGDGTRAPDDAPVATQPVGPVSPGFRSETWHDLTFEVPEDWRQGGPSGWCANGGTLDDPGPGVARPDTLSFSIGCTPAQGYGVTIGSAASYDAVDPSGSVWQYDASEATQAMYPDGAWLGYWYDDRDVVVVVTDDESVTRHVVDSVRRFEGADRNGCPPTLGDAEALTSAGPFTLCRYDGDDLLAASRSWTGEEARTAWDTLGGGFETVADTGCNAPGTVGRIAILTEEGYRGSAVVDGCMDGVAIFLPDATRKVTDAARELFASVG
jgi:hypothetical protein